MKHKNIFIFGISGQDGSYLSHLLIKKNYNVIGFTRANNKKNLVNLTKLNLKKNLKIIQYSKNDKTFIKKNILKFKPIHIYFLSGLSSVKKSFLDPVEAYKSNIVTLFEILEICRKNKLSIKIYNSSSTDCFGNQKKICDENSNFFPVSPYAKSKSYAYWLVKYYREIFKVKCVTGIVSNHESILRNNNFVSKKIIDYVKNFDFKKKLFMGNTKVYRDWGWAPDFVDAIYRINNSNIRSDYIIATGKSYSLDTFIKKVFFSAKIDKSFYKKNDNKHFRKKEVNKIFCDIKKIKNKLGWKPKHNIDQIINKLLNDKLF